MSTPSTISIPKLRADVGGHVIGADDAGYDPTNLFRLNQNIPPEGAR